ncbi:MAG: LysM peptidoglycan-binding domain-containing protein [Nitrospinota bacterium]
MKRFSAKNLLKIGLIGVLLSGCAAISTHTMKAYDEAKEAIVLAEQAGAERYARSELTYARGALNRSRSAVVAKKDEDALKFALDANKKADLARRLSMERIEEEKKWAKAKTRRQDLQMKVKSRKRRVASGQKTKTILHKVSKGENLYLLSAYYYRSARLWKRIYEANKDIINNPHLLEVGTTLKIKVRGEWTPEFSLKKWRKAELQNN